MGQTIMGNRHISRKRLKSLMSRSLLSRINISTASAEYELIIRCKLIDSKWTSSSRLLWDEYATSLGDRMIQLLSEKPLLLNPKAQSEISSTSVSGESGMNSTSGDHPKAP